MLERSGGAGLDLNLRDELAKAGEFVHEKLIGSGREGLSRGGGGGGGGICRGRGGGICSGSRRGVSVSGGGLLGGPHHGLGASLEDREFGGL